jgi:hypothetical protein
MSFKGPLLRTTGGIDKSENKITNPNASLKTYEDGNNPTEKFHLYRKREPLGHWHIQETITS